MEYTHPSASEGIDLEDPDLSRLDLDEVIPRGMRQARYNAATDDIVYLGSHVENVRRHLESQGHGERMQFYGLHHDSAEAILGDMVRPVKRRVEGYDVLEENLLDQLWDYYSVSPPSEEEWSEVMHADDQVLMWEVDQVFDGRMREDIMDSLRSSNGWDMSPEQLVDEVAGDSVLHENPVEARHGFEDSHRELLERL